MARMIIVALRNMYLPGDIAVVDTNPDALAEFEKKGHPVSTNLGAMVREHSPAYIYLAVKPMFFEHVNAALSKLTLPPEVVFVSMILGVSLRDMESLFGTRRVVRIMPNVNSEVQRGATVWATLPPSHGDSEAAGSDGQPSSSANELSPEQVAAIEDQLTCMGFQLRLTHEEHIDAATAVAGSGPAYYLLLMEAATDAGVHLGLPRQVSEQLVYATILGTVLRAENSPAPLAVLKQQVATPAGATIAALYKLEQGGLRTLIADAMWACYRRSLQVAKKPTAGVGPDRPQPVSEY